MNQLCFSNGMVKLYQTGFDRFTVRYGLQVKDGLSYPKAAKELGACLMHYAACEGRLDNRDVDEAEAAGDAAPFYSNAVSE